MYVVELYTLYAETGAGWLADGNTHKNPYTHGRINQTAAQWLGLCTAGMGGRVCMMCMYRHTPTRDETYRGHMAPNPLSLLI